MARTLWASASASHDGDGSALHPFSTIQAAIDAAEPGTVIRVGAGTYVENLVFRQGGSQDQPIELISADGHGAAIIRPAQAALDTINIDGADHIAIRDFSIHGSSDSTRQAVHVHVAGEAQDNPASFITLDGNIIHRGEGDGIKVSKSDHVTIVGNQISGGGPAEAGIDFVGVTHSVIDGNVIKDIGNIGVMLKGGSSDIRVTNNVIDGAQASGIEVGGYSPTIHYAKGFLEAGNAYEIRDVVITGNEITNIGGTALRFIGAQNVVAQGNELSASGKLVTIDDSSKYHDTWYSQNIRLEGNSVDVEKWLVDRSGGEDPAVSGNFIDGRDLVDRAAVLLELGSGRGAAEPSIPPTPPPAPPLWNEILGGTKSDTLKGKDAADRIDAGLGADKLYGFKGNDVLWGGEGNDRLYGGAGADVLTGGGGKDKFFFEGLSDVGLGASLRDLITDFESGQDRIAFDSFGVSLRFVSRDGSDFSGRKGEVVWSKVDQAGTQNDHTLVKVDVTGDRIADFDIQLTGLVDLTKNDFEF